MADSAFDQVQKYRQLMTEYEQLDHQIDKLLSKAGGYADNLLPEERSQYREMFNQRSYIKNDIRILEQELSLDE